MFITFEGIEASGKSTLMASIERALRAEGRDVVITREPGGTPAGDAVRAIFLKTGLHMSPMTEALLINASRAQLVGEVIRPALAAGAVVLCDRYVHSTLAYQGYGRGLSLEIVARLCEAATGGLMPDLTLLVDVSCETSRRRIASRGNGADRLEREGDTFHQRVRAGFLEMAARDERTVIVDGERTPQEVLDAAMAALSEMPA